jgi:hypothetical protein
LLPGEQSARVGQGCQLLLGFVRGDVLKLFALAPVFFEIGRVTGV